MTTWFVTRHRGASEQLTSHNERFGCVIVSLGDTALRSEGQRARSAMPPNSRRRQRTRSPDLIVK